MSCQPAFINWAFLFSCSRYSAINMSMYVFIGINVVLHRISNYPLQTRHYDRIIRFKWVFRMFRMCVFVRACHCMCVCVSLRAWQRQIPIWDEGKTVIYGKRNKKCARFEAHSEHSGNSDERIEYWNEVNWKYQAQRMQFRGVCRMRADVREETGGTTEETRGNESEKRLNDDGKE